jgi:trehalose synthase
VTLASTSDQWWKNGVVYCLDVETFLDGNGDGVGDLGGLVERIDYLAGIGVSTIWLMPFHPTPDLDDGYDVVDFYGVDPRLGSLGDFVEVVRTAHDRGMRVIIDLVVNHTSDRHPWFQAARSDPASPYRDWYVWADEPPDDPALAEVFPGEQGGVWTYDRKAKQHYLHRFFRHQPDLNIANPAVRDEIAKTVGFWLTLGASGFRMDAVPFLVEDVGLEGIEPGEGKRWLHSLREYAMRRRGDAMLMGEVNVEMKDLESFFEDHGDALHLQLAFLMNQRVWLALARGEATPLEDLIRRLPVPPRDSGWATFLRNHDELTLDKLEPAERDEVFAAFAPEEDMRIYGHGIRRRAASMLGGDGPRLRMAWSLLFSLPGTPVILYGDEIAMREDLRREGRMSVRTPMEWDRVARENREPDSLLRFMRRLMHQRRETPELGWGVSALIETGPAALFARRSDWQGSTVVVAHNLSEEPVTADLDLGDDVVGVDDLLELRDHVVERGRLRIELDAYGYLWLRACRTTDE